MTTVAISFDGPAGDRGLVVERMIGREAIGAAHQFDVDLLGPEERPVAVADVLGKTVWLSIDSDAGSRLIAGIVWRFVLRASEPGRGQRYRLSLRSCFARLELTRRSRNFQRLTAPEIVAIAVEGAGFVSVRKHLTLSYLPQDFIVQYDETDAAFARRICERFGLTFRIEANGRGETLVLEDRSPSAHAAYDAPLRLAERLGVDEPRPMAVEPRRSKRRRPGRVELRDYDPERSTAELLSRAASGNDHERGLEVFGQGAAGAQDANLRLQALRGDADRLSFDSNAWALAPGLACSLESDDGASPAALAAKGSWLVVEVSSDWQLGQAARLSVDAVPLETPYRLPHHTPRPRAAGVHSAIVTGASGREIHPDQLGRVHLRFHWDKTAAGDHASSKPVRVAQPQAPGALIVPRVGWEVLTMFEDGDPERPIVLGRSYNAKQLPPLPLPANKTVSSIASDSTPGAAQRTVIQIDDAAGREHLSVSAPFAMDMNIVRHASRTTAEQEIQRIGKKAHATVRRDEHVTVVRTMKGSYGSREVTVTGGQYHRIGGSQFVHVGSELALIGGAQLEQIGNPLRAIGALAYSFVFTQVYLWGKWGKHIARLAGSAWKIGEAWFLEGGSGAAREAARAAPKFVLGFVPGTDALLAYLTGTAKSMPWEKKRQPDAPAPRKPDGTPLKIEDDHGSPEKKGWGHRVTMAKRSYAEVVFNRSNLITPGSVQWVTVGPAVTFVNGSHLTKTGVVTLDVGGISDESFGSQHIDSLKDIKRELYWGIHATVRDAYQVRAKGEFTLQGQSLVMKVAGKMNVAGPVSFKCGNSHITSGPEGVEISAETVRIRGLSKQTGGLTQL
jgi:type VI secretion system secreted protein VgrG